MLSCNDLFRSAIPGLDQTNCIPTSWLFTPLAREVLIEWEAETSRAISTTWPVLARYRDSVQAHDIMRHLSANKEFRRLAQANTAVIYGRPSTSLLHVRNPDTGDIASWRVAIADTGQPQNLQLLIITRKPYSGPPLTNST
ncbi:hypothetical protein IU434_27405 [Nocardia farcinica]|nr:hypothetical protein [Nocardia farcinica]